MKKAAAFLFAILLFIVFLPSCASQKSSPHCRELLAAMTKAEVGLPAGKYYSLTAPEGHSEYLSESLISALFGGGSYPSLAQDWIDAALFLSSGTHPCEFAIILCDNRDSAIDTARLMNSRLASIRIAKSPTEYSKMIEKAKVSVIGNYALLIISSDSETALKIFKKALNQAKSPKNQ